MVFPDNNGTGADLFDNIEVMGGRNNRLTALRKILDELYQPDLAAWVKTTGRFVKEQDIGICGQDRCDTDLLFLASAQHVGRPVPEVFDPQHCDNLFRPHLYFIGRQVELERTKGNLVKNG